MLGGPRAQALSQPSRTAVSLSLSGVRAYILFSGLEIKLNSVAGARQRLSLSPTGPGSSLHAV